MTAPRPCPLAAPPLAAPTLATVRPSLEPPPAPTGVPSTPTEDAGSACPQHPDSSSSPPYLCSLHTCVYTPASLTSPCGSWSPLMFPGSFLSPQRSTPTPEL